MQRLPTPLPPSHLFRNKWNGADFISCVLVSPVKIWLRWTNRSWAKTVKQYETARFDCKYRKQPQRKSRIACGLVKDFSGIINWFNEAESFLFVEPHAVKRNGASWRFSQRSSTYGIKSINFMRSRLSKTLHMSKVSLGCRAISLVHAREVLHPQPDWKQLLLQHLLVLSSQPSPCRLMTPRSQQVESLNC